MRQRAAEGAAVAHLWVGHRPGRLGEQRSMLAARLVERFERLAPFVRATVPGGPAEKAKIPAGDCVLGIGSHLVKSISDASRELRRHHRSGAARKIAYDWLVRVDSSAPALARAATPVATARRSDSRVGPDGPSPEHARTNAVSSAT